MPSRTGVDFPPREIASERLADPSSDDALLDVSTYAFVMLSSRLIQTTTSHAEPGSLRRHTRQQSTLRVLELGRVTAAQRCRRPYVRVIAYYCTLHLSYRPPRLHARACSLARLALLGLSSQLLEYRTDADVLHHLLPVISHTTAA